MAAEVPAKDVLCEAMEYLSKLGSNLRIRSENLREKKIRREKLNNVLAVQKAANKVLLICELSKKSLENVEIGVRKVLDLVDTSQASSSDGGKNSKIEKDVARKHHYYYFVYKTRKLRIKNRISFKHYDSARVYAKMLPKSMIDKYPVHYDCELYRMRRKQVEEKQLHRVEEDTERKDPQHEVSIEEDTEKRDPHLEVSIISIPDSPTSKSKSEDKENKNDKKSNNDVSVISIPDSPEPNSKNKDKAESSTSKDNMRKLSEESVKERSASRESDVVSKNNSEKSYKQGKSAKKRKCFDSTENLKKKRIIHDSSSDNEVKTDVNNKNGNPSNDSDVSCQESDSKKQIISDDNESLKSSVNDGKTEANDNQSEKSDDDNDEGKPVIKCVSLSKLLKPNILEKETPEEQKKHQSHSKTKAKVMTAKQYEELKKGKKVQEKVAREMREEDEYWKQKRSEVGAFEPKEFVINITRLPELSVDYLNKLSLKKIVQGGITVCEVIVESDAISEKDGTETSGIESRNDKDDSISRRASTNSCDNNDDALIAEANKVKNSLLNQSDSDMNDSDNEFTSSKKNTDNIKNALLRDSDSETKNSDNGSKSGDDDKTDKNSVRSDTSHSKKALCKDSDSDQSETKSRSNVEKQNTSLLDEDHSSKQPGTESDAEQNKSSAETETSEKEEIHQKKNNDDSDDSLDENDKNLGEDHSSKQPGTESDAEQNKSSAETNETSEKEDIHQKNQDNDDSDDSLTKNDKNLKEKNEKTPEKDTDKAKSTLLNDSSEDETKTPLRQRMSSQSKKKRMRESVQAKKMLLTYSSSDTEDEQLKDALKEIKHSLLHGSDEEKKPSRVSHSSSSDEDVIKKVKKHKTHRSGPSKQIKHKHKKRKLRRRLDSEDSSKSSDHSKSSSSKMVRSKLKPGNSSSQNSDAPDSNDKDIDGLTNLNTLNKPRRRNTSSSEMSEANDFEERKAKERSSKSGIKPTGLIAEDILKAESSSESAASADEVDDVDDQPEIVLPSVNGGGEHLVKEDLLGESDSSSNNEDQKSVKEESGSEDKPNTKRRKVNAISSDSEVGSSRKKDADVKLSDFEDSEDSDVNNKRSKRKKKATDSDASAGTSSNEGGKKKRRRIKSLNDSDGSGSESETEGRNKHGRKNIRKVMGKNQLEEATKKAARQEKERIARIAERQKMYNNLEFDESGKPDEVVLDKVVLDFDPETKEPLIEVDRGLVKKLKPHQANGIKFMWDACFESVKRIKKDKGSGCILAHCMGLGKTLQVVSLTHTLLTHGELTKVNRVLVVCPLSTVLNWVNEFRMWLKYTETEYEVEVYELSRHKQNSERAFQLSQWVRHGGVCVLGYEMFRNLSADNTKKFKKKMLQNFQEALVDPGPDLVVCDEGHLLKNEKTSLSQSMNRVKTLRRIVLTGTPLQNNLKEYYCMVQFVKPNLLGKYNEYLNRFVNPITNGQYTDSTEHDIKIMKRRSHVLHKMLDGAVQRRDYGVLAPFLPPKHEYVLFITLSDVQVKLYQHYLDNFSRKPLPGKSSGFLFPDFQSLQRIWTHPLVLKYNSERYEIMQQKKRDKEEEDSEGSLRDFIDDDSTPEETSSEDLTDDSSDQSDDSRKKSKKKKKSAKKSKGKDKDAKSDAGQSRPRRGTRANPVELEEEDQEEVIELKNENPTEWWIKMVTEDEVEDMRNSHKLVLLFEILRQCEAIGDKLLVFSQSLYSLDLIEHFLGKVDDATQEGRIDEKLGGHIGTWSPGIDYFRLDGSTSCENRSIWCKNFNREDNPRARLFLISTRAGGLGINLVAANRVVIFDVSWNPSHDVQSIFRVYRFGQKKPCYVYRFLAMGTMEEKIYERQVTKQAISKRVIDEQQIDRHYAENDLAELYKFEPQPPTPRPIPPLPKDRLFAEMLREHEVQIYKYHEHDSLLENKEEETLSEEERKAAWEDFENEKNRPPPAPFPNTWQMPNILQQQQLAYAALAAMLRKDMPNLSDNQLRDMLPLIYNSNPQLMQKLSEIYKYSPGMMNPAMMNPGVMNAAGAMGAMSGASGLQYEPPWMRQQRQPQQMRLQQMLQHQNQMGAKFYAGGLGSRDPVAMALQQQRAREIMLTGAGGAGGGAGAGAGAGRPRGRPPLQPRAPPSGDVVNLDSD